jgi:hypothetical protein
VSTVSSAATASSAPVACKQPSPPDLPDAAGQVTDADSGAFCLNASQQIDAFLTAPGGTAAVTDHWVQIKSSDPQVLAYGDNSVLTTPVSVTAGVFVARKAGTAVLTSTLSSGKTWSVTIVVP